MDPVDPDAARQRADGLAAADVDPDMGAAAPDHEVADLRVGPARQTARLVPAVQRAGRAQVAVGDRPGIAGVLEGVDDHAGAVESARAAGAVPPRAAERRAGDADDLLRLGAALLRLDDRLHDGGDD